MEFIFFFYVFTLLQKIFILHICTKGVITYESCSKYLYSN
nr:MAG TPA: hypothetical protein [Caudoviricetes sp.]